MKVALFGGEKGFGEELCRENQSVRKSACERPVEALVSTAAGAGACRAQGRRFYTSGSFLLHGFGLGVCWQGKPVLEKQECPPPALRRCSLLNEAVEAPMGLVC